MAENGQDPQVEGQEEGQQEPQAEPQIDELDQAYKVISEREGWDPRLTRFQMEEMKQRREDLERRERELARELEAARRPRSEPQYEPELDPQVAYLNKKIDRVMSVLEEERQQRAYMEEAQAKAEREGLALRHSYTVLMRQSGIPEREIETRAPKFFQAMEELYPEGIPERIGIEGAVRNTHQFISGGKPYSGGNGYGGSGGTISTTRVTPRTPVVTAQGTGPVEDRSDFGPQRQGESNEQYAQRVMREFEALGKGIGLRDGQRVSSE